MRLKEWVKENKNVFNETDLRFLLKESFSFDALYLDDLVLEDNKLEMLNSVKSFYRMGKPLAYILGKEIFFGLDFKVNDFVLIPRKETELVCEKAIKIIKEKKIDSILDLCCGCANIAISILKSIDEKIFAIASDLSQEALKIADLNRKSHKIDLKLINSELFTAFRPDSFELIITNPPYVEEGLIKGSLEYEPKMALYGGRDGFLFIKEILTQAHIYLKKSGYLLMEIGFRHKELTEELISSIGKYVIEEWIKDYAGHYRAIVLKCTN